ncbi:MAG: VWA domain-containing protein [Deltaproteobacteria bacterium]|nr:VWA domain-containing protein [Deltaproteobacteria bacterium]
MDDRIVEFTHLLRRHGARVSLSEDIDAISALGILGIEDPSMFRDGLRATLIKRAADIRTFEELFDLFFLGLGAAVRESERDLMGQLGLTPQQYQELLEEIRRMLQRQPNLTPLARALLAGDLTQAERLIRQAIEREELEQAGGQIAVALYLRLAGRLALGTVEEELGSFREMALAGLDDPGHRQRLSRYLERRLQDLSRMVRDLLRQELKKRSIVASERERLEYLTQKSFAYYTEEDIQRMNEAVVRLAQRFKNLLTLRRRKARRGRFDLQETLRKNLQYGGVPFRIQLDRRKREKPQILILCDVSDSVLNASRFMLQFVYSVQDLYSKVRSFVFVSELGEVTRLFEDNDLQQAVELALKGEVVNVYSHSNFGRAFELFYREHFSSVNGKTTVMVIGDGRNNYNRPNDWVLKEIQRKAKRLIWLNPESRWKWGFGDSEMPRYAACCDVVEECGNLSQLHRVIERIAR